jgi:hypothetical protein
VGAWPDEQAAFASDTPWGNKPGRKKQMTEEIKTQQIAEDSTKAVPSFREGHTVDMSNGGERTTLAFNRYLFLR